MHGRESASEMPAWTPALWTPLIILARGMSPEVPIAVKGRCGFFRATII